MEESLQAPRLLEAVKDIASRRTWQGLHSVDVLLKGQSLSVSPSLVRQELSSISLEEDILIALYIVEKAVLTVENLSSSSSSSSMAAQQLGDVVLGCCVVLEHLTEEVGLMKAGMVRKLTRFVATAVDNDSEEAALVLDALVNGLKCSKQQGILTGSDVDVIQVALISKQYRFGARMLESDLITQVDKSMVAVDVMRYFYYAGRVFTGLKLWDKATECLETVISLPASSLSMVAVCSYRMLVLVSLIKSGKKPTLSKLTSTVVRNALGRKKPIPEWNAYIDLAQAFQNGFEPLRECIESNYHVFVADGLAGLANQTLNAFRVHTLKKLEQIYFTLDVQDVAKRLYMEESGEKELEKLVLQLADQGAVSLRLEGRVFHFVERRLTEQQSAHLDVEMGRLQDLLWRLRDIDVDLSTSKPYVASKLRGAGSGGVETSEPSSVDFVGAL